MPANFPEMWVARVEQRLVTTDQAPWLNGIPEIAADVSEINGGSATEQNQIHIPTTDFEVDILINNNTYPIPVQQYDDDTVTISLDKYQTKQVPLTDDQVLGASYDVIDTVTNIMTTNIVESKYAKAIHSLAPMDNTSDAVIVFETTGKTGRYDANGHEIIMVDVDGRLMLTPYDMNNIKREVNNLAKEYRWPLLNRRLVLCSDHEADLSAFNDRFANLVSDMNSGEVASSLKGFNLFTYLQMPVYVNGVKQAYGAVPDPAESAYEASVGFHIQNVGVKTGLTKQYYSPANINPGTQANTVAYRHYFVCVPKRTRYILAIVSGKQVQA